MQLLQHLLFSKILSFYLTINLKKTKILSERTHIPPTFNIESKYVENVKSLYTLALVLRQTNQWTPRLIVALVKLQELLLDCLEVFWITPSFRTKSAVYRACVCITLLYGSETWTLSTMQGKRIKLTPSTNNASSVLLELDGNIRLPTEKYWDVLVLSLCTPLYAQASLTWSCSENERRAHPKASAIQLNVDKRNVGRPRLHYKDAWKCDLKSWKSTHIDDWEKDRDKWRSLIMERLYF